MAEIKEHNLAYDYSIYDEEVQAEAEKAKADLANSEAELAKLKSLKTVSVTMKLENQTKATQDRMGLVNEIMAEKKLDFDSAWAEAKAKKPELFAK